MIFHLLSILSHVQSSLSNLCWNSFASLSNEREGTRTANLDPLNLDRSISASGFIIAQFSKFPRPSIPPVFLTFHGNPRSGSSSPTSR